MKTNQVLSRRMGRFEVLQRTSDGMFNATTLLKQWNLNSGQKKDISHFFSNVATQEFINTLQLRENFNSRNSVYLKSAGKYNGGTWMHPLLFIDFAMWINPSFKYDVLKFVYDELIRYRNDAGDAYREMSAAIAKIVSKPKLPEVIQNVARALNYIVYGSHESGLRNKNADESTMRELFELERKVAYLISEGFIANYEHLMQYLRKLWNQKYQPKVLSA